jgi:chromosome partitioning protein
LVEAADVNRLSSVLKKQREKGIQWAVIDLPGRSAPVTSAGMVASDMILIPARPLDVDIEASWTTMQSAIRGNKRYAYLMNISPPNSDKKQARQVAAVLEKGGHPVAPAIIVQRAIVPNAIAVGKGVNEAEPQGAASKEFAELFAWLKENVKGREA